MEAYILVMSNKNVIYIYIDTNKVILNQTNIIKGSKNNLRDGITILLS